MNSFYSDDELLELGLLCLGKNVKISRKSSIYGKDIVIGNNVRIDDFCILSGKIRIGNFVHIAAYSALYGGNKGILIDDFANISSRVTVYSINDDYSGRTMTNPMVPDMFKNVEEKMVTIGRHVIIGSTSVVLPGVVLAEGSAFGSFSFIKDSTEPWSLNYGIPCKKYSNRSKDLLHLEIEFKKYINK